MGAQHPMFLDCPPNLGSELEKHGCAYRTTILRLRATALALRVSFLLHKVTSKERPRLDLYVKAAVIAISYPLRLANCI